MTWWLVQLYLSAELDAALVPDLVSLNCRDLRSPCTGKRKIPVHERIGFRDYSSLIEVTFNVLPCRSPLTFTRR
jgi:hypothetical protein